MLLFWSDFSGLLPVVEAVVVVLVVLVLEGCSDVWLDVSGCCLVMVISRLWGSDDMVAVLEIVGLGDA